jgi:hypothetical protein
VCLASLILASPAHAANAAPSAPQCALGRVPSVLRSALPKAIAAEQRRFTASLDGVAGAEQRRAATAFTTGVEAYLYGMPTVLTRLTVERYPRNQLIGVGKLATPSLKSIVAPNHDTLYSISRIDLGDGPLVVDAPATEGRYSVLQLLDAYTDVIGYVGSGDERDRAAAVAVVPPGWQGTVPAGLRVIDSSTKLVWLLGRTLVDGPDDVAAASGLMARYSLTPLGDWVAGRRNASAVLDTSPGARSSVELPSGLAFYDALGVALAADPPPARDACALRAFARWGIGPGRTPSSAADELTARALSAAAPAGGRVVDAAVEATRRASRRKHNGWSFSASDAGHFGTDYANRATTAQVGLASNVASEALYPTADTDDRGRPLNGRHDYVVFFPAGDLPPVRAFWSLTLYDQRLRLVANPLDRYAIGDRSDGLRYGPGRSLRIHVGSHAPDDSRRANWLPAPAGRFTLYLRLYEPAHAAIDGTWTPPTVRRVR